jgi:hypothetical protein
MRSRDAADGPLPPQPNGRADPLRIAASLVLDVSLR